jgi:phage terminase small subunit
MRKKRRTTALTPKQARFVAEYLIDLNGKQAAIRAGYKPSRAEQTASELLRDRKVSEGVAAGKRRQLAAADVSAVRVLEELRRVALCDAGAFWTRGGALKRIDQLPPDARACLAGFEAVIKNVAPDDDKTDLVHKIKLWDKVKALELLGKHFGLFVEKIELKDMTAAARVARLVAARRRVGDVG